MFKLRGFDYVVVGIMLLGFLLDWIFYKRPPQFVYILFFGTFIIMMSMINEIRDLQKEARK